MKCRNCGSENVEMTKISEAKPLVFVVIFLFFVISGFAFGIWVGERYELPKVIASVIAVGLAFRVGALGEHLKTTP